MATPDYPRVSIDVAADGVGMASFSSHKIGGPQGVGALYMANWIDLQPISTSGGQEDGLRPGTVPTAIVVGFGEACALAKRTMAKEAKRITGLRERFLERLREAGVAFEINGSLEQRVPANLNLRLEGVDAGSLIDSLFDVCISTGSACRSGAIAPSHVLVAMGLEGRALSEAIGVSFGRTTSLDDVDHAVERISGEAEASTARAQNAAAHRKVVRSQAAAACKRRPTFADPVT